MKLTGSRHILRSQQVVWDALNDPGVLARSIPGCEKLERTAPDEFQMEMLAAVGPVRAKFKSRLTLSEVVPPLSYVITFAGNGGAAGFGNGTARVRLDAEQAGTLMHYEANAQVGGKIAQVGARLVQGVSEKLAEQFFTRFVAEVETSSPAPAIEAPTPTPARERVAEPVVAVTAVADARRWYGRPWIWAAASAALAIALWWWFAGD